MAHPCGAQMERNLSRILTRVGRFLTSNLTATSLSNKQKVPWNLFVAVSRDGIQDERFPQFQGLARENLQTLNEYVGDANLANNELEKHQQPGRLLEDQYPVVECGSEMMKRYAVENPSRAALGGTLLEQVINFDLAVQADVFVGVEMSSYSNAVWTARVHLGQGQNYKYTTTGVDRVEGLPNPHGNCRRRRRPPPPQMSRGQTMNVHNP